MPPKFRNMNTIVNENSEVYYNTQYWNDFPQVLEYMSENFTGDKQKWWVQDFKDRFASEKFEHGLFLNCGNGWVEREFLDKGIVKKATSFDYSWTLLQDAKSQKGDRLIDYFQVDVNKVTFKDNSFDLIINVAALHHVQFINRLCFVLARALRAGGIFINYDYIGPRRNQYSFLNWLLIKTINRALPRLVRKPRLRRPHLPTMLYADPTEAIHSDKIISTMLRYFDIFERHDTGGGIAYEILTNNPKLQKVSKETLEQNIDRVLYWDRLLTKTKMIPSLFSYFLAKPHKGLLQNESVVSYYQQLEDEREKKALRNFGAYSLSDIIFLSFWRIRRWFRRWFRRYEP